MKKLLIIILVLLGMTIFVVLFLDSSFFRSLTGNVLPKDDKEAVKKVLSKTQDLNTETNTKGDYEYSGESKDLKAEFDGKSYSIKKDNEAALRVKVKGNTLIENLPQEFDLKIKPGNSNLFFNTSFSELWFGAKNLMFNVSPEAVLSAKKAGDEFLDSKKYSKYEFEFNPKALINAEDKRSKIKGELLVDEKKLLAKKITIDALIFTPEGSQTVIKKEDVYISYKSQIAVITPSNPIETVFSPEGLNILLRDIIRKNDLKKIQAALEKYKNDKGDYPVLAVDSLSADFLSVLKGSYLTDIPKDPKLGYYYKYESSDGKEYNLTCVLENPLDTEGEKQGNFNIYKLSPAK